jgi:hypothetical protein
MAGMSITVCLPARAAGRLEAAVAEVMAPFEIEAGLTADEGVGPLA